MSATSAPLTATRMALAAALTASLLTLAIWIGRAPIHVPLLSIVAAVLFGATLLHAQAGLVILILSMLLSPEFAMGGAGGSGLEGSRSVVLRTEDLVLLIVGLAWAARMAIHKDLGAVRRTSLNVWMVAYGAACLLSTLVGIEAGRVRALVGLCYVAKYVEYFIIFFITVNYVRTPRQLRHLLAAVLITAAAITLYAYWQIPLGMRPSAPFEGPEGEPNTLGGYLVLIFSVACAIGLTAAERRWCRWCAVLAVATVPPLLATLSRSSWIGLLFSLTTLLVLSSARRRLAAAAIIGVTLLFFAHPRSVEERIAYTFTGERESVRVGHVALDPSSSARLSSWGSALKGFLEHPVVGWGVTGYGFLDAQYFRVLVEIGTIGFAAFSLMLVACGRAFFRALAPPGDTLHQALGLGMLAALAGLMGHAVGTNTFLLIRIMEPFWLLTGLTIAALSFEGRS